MARFGGEHAATLGVLLASALGDIHAASLFHRDLKPGNILLGREAEDHRPRLVVLAAGRPT